MRLSRPITSFVASDPLSLFILSISNADSKRNPVDRIGLPVAGIQPGLADVERGVDSRFRFCGLSLLTRGIARSELSVHSRGRVEFTFYREQWLGSASRRPNRHVAQSLAAKPGVGE